MTTSISSGRSPRLHLEALEERIAPAGAVIVTVTGGTLNIIGGDEGDSVTVDAAGLGANQVRVTGVAGTTVNGGASAILDGWSGSLKAKMGGGDDDVELGHLNVAGDVSVDGGTGFNQLHVDTVTVGGKFTVKNGTGVDWVLISDLTVTKDIIISNGAGNSVVLIEDSSALSLKITNGAGYDNPVIIGFETVKGISISNGTGGCGVRVQDFTCGMGVSIKNGTSPLMENTTFVVDGVINDSLVVANGTGDAAVVVDNVHVGMGPKLGDVKISAGVGQHAVVLTSVDANRNMIISVADGRTDATFDGVSVDKNLTFKSKGGLDTGEIVDTSVFGKTVFDTGNGIDMFSFDYCNFIHDFTFKAGAGNDVLELETEEFGSNPQTNFGGKVKIDMGTDDDTLNIGLSGVADSMANFDDMVFLIGGKGTDTLDWMDNGNDFFVPPSTKDFEVIQ